MAEQTFTSIGQIIITQTRLQLNNWGSTQINDDLLEDPAIDTYVSRLQVDADGAVRFRTETIINSTGSTAGPDLNSAFETSGTIHIAVDTHTFDFVIADATYDPSEPYNWLDVPGTQEFVDALTPGTFPNVAVTIRDFNPGAVVVAGIARYRGSTGIANTYIHLGGIEHLITKRYRGSTRIFG